MPLCWRPSCRPCAPGSSAGPESVAKPAMQRAASSCDGPGGWALRSRRPLSLGTATPVCHERLYLQAPGQFSRQVAQALESSARRRSTATIAHTLAKTKTCTVTVPGPTDPLHRELQEGGTRQPHLSTVGSSFAGHTCCPCTRTTRAATLPCAPSRLLCHLAACFVNAEPIRASVPSDRCPGRGVPWRTLRLSGRLLGCLQWRHLAFALPMPGILPRTCSVHPLATVARLPVLSIRIPFPARFCTWFLVRLPEAR